MTTRETEPDRSVSGTDHRLLAPFTAEQQAVVDILSKVWIEHSEWPNRRFVEHEMDRRDLALETVLPSFPSMQGANSGPFAQDYQAVWYDRVSGAPDGRVGLTVAGIAHLPESQRGATLVFLRLLNAMATYFLDQPVDPFKVEDLDVSMLDLVRQAQISDDKWADWVVPILEHEPATWGGRGGTTPGGATRWRYGRALRHFMGPEMRVSDYLWRVDAYLAPPRPDSVSQSIPPLSLLAALDFLDVVWLLRCNTRLLRLPSAAAAASLAEEAQTAEEFDARLSALGQVLKGFSVPRTKGGANHPVQFLAAKLLADLPPESHERVQRSIAILEAAVLVRNAQQHVHAAPKSVNALGTLGLTYPVTEWTSGWVTIRNRVTTALWAIREELQGSLVSNEDR